MGTLLCLLLGVLLLGVLGPLHLLEVPLLEVLNCRVDCYGWFPLLRWGDCGQLHKG